MKLVIWGLGFRGRTLVDYLGNQYVAAIIESDSGKVGQKYREIDVISLETYIKEYQPLPIIITPEYQFQKEISHNLIEHHIYHFIFSSELPPNIRYNGKFDMDSYLDMMRNTENVCLYGINAFSLVLYFMLSRHGRQVRFILEKGHAKQNQSSIAELLQLHIINMELLDIREPLYITTHESKADLDNMFTGMQWVDAFRYADAREEYRNLELKKFHNLYANKRRCFIVATGPSLMMTDLDILSEKQEFCFSVNSMCKIETRWKPDVYVVSDGKFFWENQEVIRRYPCPIKFLPDDSIDFWNEREDGEYKIHRDSIDAYDVLEFSEDITQIVHTQGTVTVGCIQIAVYMGFKEIYLLGTDCNYVFGSSSNHFGGDGKPDMIDHSISAMVKGYQMCREFADAHGIKIYNATRGGMLEVFQRVKFDSLFI